MIFSDDAKLCGISFYRRNRRRALVVVTYILALVYVGVIAFAPLRLSNAALAGFCVAGVTVTNILFGSVVRPTLSHQKRHLQSLGIANSAFNEDDLDPDEYETALRNDAHYKAYKVMVVVFVAGSIPMAALMDHGARHYASIGIATIVLLCLLLVSLPQAVILWQHPDLIEKE